MTVENCPVGKSPVAWDLDLAEMLSDFDKPGKHSRASPVSKHMGTYRGRLWLWGHRETSLIT